MIHYKDLMIGNWVYSSERTKFPMKVVNIGEDYCYLDFEGNEGDVWEVKDKDMMPIEVTEELLLKIGFTKSSAKNIGGNHIYNIEVADFTVSILKEVKGDCFFCCIYNESRKTELFFLMKYLHELQNGIRLITKSDLEIKEL